MYKCSLFDSETTSMVDFLSTLVCIQADIAWGGGGGGFLNNCIIIWFIFNALLKNNFYTFFC